VPIQLTSDAYSFLDDYERIRDDADSEYIHVKRQCMHCVHPACVSACTVGALRKDENGAVIYQSEKCIGCRYCQYACPFGVPTYDWENPLGLIHKCELCTHRLADGQLPACIEACPNGALRFGKRRELLAQAKGQIASNPGRYVDHVYGEHEAGGTQVLYLSPVPFHLLGLPTLDGQPIPRYAEAVMEQTPAIALTVASIVTALHLFMQRRHHVQAEVPVHARDPKPGADL
jgi:formate dehydrogenase iron-sulfur subunit